MRITGFIIMIIALLVAILSINGYVVQFVNLSALIFLILASSGVIVGTASFKTFIMGLNGALFNKYHISKDDCDKVISLFTLLKKTNVQAAILSTIITIMILLTRLDDPQYIGPILALSLTAIFYCAFINMALLNPAIYILQHKNDENPVHVAKIKDKEALDKLQQLCFEKGLTYEDIMDADEILLKRK